MVASELKDSFRNFAFLARYAGVCINFKRRRTQWSKSLATTLPQTSETVRLDLELTYEGMIKELKALESLLVGDMMWTIDSKQRVISTRWVVAAKNERIDGKEAM